MNNAERDERIEALETEVSELKEEISELKRSQALTNEVARATIKLLKTYKPQPPTANDNHDN